jgi:hypothetical protein
MVCLTCLGNEIIGIFYRSKLNIAAQHPSKPEQRRLNRSIKAAISLFVEAARK